MRRTTALALVFVVVIGVGAPALFGMLAWVRITEPYRGYGGTEQFVEIPPGTGAGDIAARLVDAGIVMDRVTFRLALWWTRASRSLKAGEYRFDRPMSTVAVVEKIAKGDVYTYRITFPEGLTILEMAKVYESNGFGPAQAFVDAARDVSLVRDLDPAAPDLEGYLFPDTYAIPRGIAPATLIAQMVGSFRAAYTADLQREAQSQRLSVRQVVTLASLVEKETAQASERPLVSAVYTNRFRLGMGMQADPTIVYALQKAGRYDGNIRREDLALDSPYNTYKYPGLPPGPIASPGKASLEAALAPADVPYLYFVSRNDGTHVFATTLSEHNRNVQRFQIKYFRERRRELGRQGKGE